ncbi:response regulator transcription factor [Shewanella sp. SNU WT4]|uniref:response regulator transcription factor n=1 Tax=Shewanella sp. SNU WT4 TaxID=2590015 RepID=UPI00112A3B6F|nr:response regulator [Shewanella sp. SNU WT4]QDF67262.1 response regulator transcription factor [Shewanella sp. SNU WT4]
MTPLYLVDDDQDVLDSLSWMLEGMGFASQSFTCPANLLSAVDIHAPAVMLLDIHMPGMDGMALLQHLVKLQSPIQIIMLTGHGNIAMAVQSMRVGALDFLEKPADGDKLKPLLLQAMQVSEQAYAAHNQHQLLRAQLNSLSPREHQVMTLVLAGKMNKVIASELELAQRTVELHKQKLLQKMQVSNAAELAWQLAKHQLRAEDQLLVAGEELK